MSGAGRVGVQQSSQVEQIDIPEPPPPPEAPAPEAAPEAPSFTGARAMSGGFQAAALASRFQAEQGIPQQSTDPAVAVHQNHNIVNPGNVVRPLSATMPVTVNTPAEVLRQVDMMAQHWSSQPPPQNSLGVFPTAYTEMTRGLQNQAAEYLRNGETEKAQAIYDVMVPFGNRFFEAFSAYQRGDMASVPEPWRFAFDRGLETPPPSVASSLQMAMNAHILNDLPQVLRDGQAAGRPGFDLSSAADRAAFREYNDAFASARLPITEALNRNYPGNDVGTVAGTAEALGLGQFGVGTAVDIMRTKAWDDAANPNVSVADLGRNSTNLARTGYHALRAAHGTLDVARDVGRTIESGAEVVADGARRGAEAVADGARRGAEAVVDGARRGADAVADGARNAADEIERRASGAWNDFLNSL